MSKIITIPSNINEIDKTIDIIDGFIIGIKNMSVNANMYMDIDELEVLNNYKDKDIFISLNKNMHNQDLDLVKNILIKLNAYDIKGVLYADTGVLNIYNTLSLNYDLIWSNEHSTTNYNTINYWYSKGARGTYISSDITEEEIINITKNTKSTLMSTIFGYLPMFVSKRHIVKNYLQYFNLKDDSRVNYMEKEGKIYPIIDDNIATSVYSNNILNGIKSYININIPYIVLNSFNIELYKFIDIIGMFRTVNNDNADEYFNRINSMFKNIDEGFLNTKTIYKVKKNDK